MKKKMMMMADSMGKMAKQKKNKSWGEKHLKKKERKKLLMRSEYGQQQME